MILCKTIICQITLRLIFFIVLILLDCREPKNINTFCLYECGIPHDDTQASYTVVAMSYNSFRIM